MTPEGHFARYRVFQHWKDGLTWTGTAMLVLAATLLCTGNPVGCVITVLVFIPVAIARDACADHAEQHLCASCSRLWHRELPP